MYLFYAGLGAIYMNHYRHPKDSYAYNMLDGLVVYPLVYPLVAVTSGFVYPRLFRHGGKAEAFAVTST